MKNENEELARMSYLASRCGYNEELKGEYRWLGRRVLKALATALGLAPGQYDIRWNPGGIAVSGDHRLHSDKLYVAMDDNCGFGFFYFRSCKGRKDYSGGPNQSVRWVDFRAMGIDGLAKKIMQKGLA
jgi:hypothetical protein